MPENFSVSTMELRSEMIRRLMALALDYSISAAQRMERLRVLPQHEAILKALRKLAEESGVGLTG